MKQNEALLKPLDNNTQLTFKMLFDSADECKKIKALVEVAMSKF